MVVELPAQFLKWNYHSRRDNAREFLEGKHEQDMNRFLLDSTRHNPALCTACRRGDGSIFVNAKIVGIGYVPREERLAGAVKAFKRHLEFGDGLFKEAGESRTKKDEALKEYQRRAMLLLMEHLYLPQEEARAAIDFTKMSTAEMAKSKPASSKHTWQIIQENRTACLLFYRPYRVSFELHGWLDIHTNDLYQEFVISAHDAFHYAPPEERNVDRPVLIFNVEEVFDNGPAPTAFGKKIA